MDIGSIDLINQLLAQNYRHRKRQPIADLTDLTVMDFTDSKAFVSEDYWVWEK